MLALLRLLPTRALLAALAERDGVQSYGVPRGGQRAFKLCGPARVVIVREVV